MFGRNKSYKSSKEIEAASEKVREKYLEISLKVCENPQYYAYSDHLLYVGKVAR